MSAGRICCFLPQSFNLIFLRRESGAIAEPMCNYHHDDDDDDDDDDDEDGDYEDDDPYGDEIQ